MPTESKESVKPAASSSPKSGRPKKVRPVADPPAPVGPPEIKPGEVEQSNCIARLEHAKIRMANQQCPHCGYPGEWIGLRNAQPIRHVATERMAAPAALQMALGHLDAMLTMSAGKTANDTPTLDFCELCDGHHGSGGFCPCACHPAREFLNQHRAAYL